MKKLSSLFLLLVLVTGVQAQSDTVKSPERNVSGQGKVTIRQDSRIAALLDSAPPSISEQKILEPSGYRVQACAGNNTHQTKNGAHNVDSRVKEYFLKLFIYTFFSPPRWLCRVGDSRSIERASAVMHKLKVTGTSKEVSIVKDQINISL